MSEKTLKERIREEMTVGSEVAEREAIVNDLILEFPEWDNEQDKERIRCLFDKYKGEYL